MQLLLALALSILLPYVPNGRVALTRHPDGRLARAGAYRGGVKTGTHTAWWPNGTLRSIVQYSDDAYDGIYETWYPSGARYELRHYRKGHESGRQQSWTEDGTLYLNYEVRGGRRYGLVNARPCVTTSETGAELPYYTTADFTPEWTPTPARALTIALTSQSGAAITGTSLAGRPYVASFFFARCSTICPTLTQQLKRVQDATSIRLVSYSVTPATDTPEALAEYGRRHGIDATRWLLLTGDAASIYRAARTFYFAGDSRATGATDFLHTEKVLLVDAEGRLRGVYDGTLPHDIDRLIEDASVLGAVK
jgi:protein SCO1/2